MSDAELSIKLLEIQQQIAATGDRWVIRNTLRQKAARLAAAFVDPNFERDETPVVVRDGAAMAANIDPVCGF